DVALGRLALRAEASARDRARRIALDVRDLAALHIDELAAADCAVRADRPGDALCVVDARAQRPRALRLHGLSECERIALAKLSEKGPRLEPLPQKTGHAGPTS